MPALSVIIKLQHSQVSIIIFSLNMKVSSILVISVILNLHYRVIFKHIFSLNMEVSSILAINAIIKLHSRAIFRDIYSESTNSIDHRFFSDRSSSVITIVSSLFYEIHFYILLCSPHFYFDIHLVHLLNLKLRFKKHGPLCQINKTSTFDGSLGI